MKILALVRTEADLNPVVEYVKNFANADDTIHLLNIINVSGNIPTKKETGEVLDDCSEFDVSQYYNQRKINEQWLNKTELAGKVTSIKTIIGSRYPVLKYQVSLNHIDVIVTKTEQTSNSLDLFKYSSTEFAHDHLAVPVLTIKCDKSQEELKDIAIISDFIDTDIKDLNVLKQIANKSNAKITLYAFNVQDESEFEIEKRMSRFIEKEQLKNAEKIIIKSKSKEKSASELLLNYPMQLMVVLDIHRIGLSKILKGNLEKYIMNHNLIPILAY